MTVKNSPQFSAEEATHPRLAELGKECSKKVGHWLESGEAGKIKGIWKSPAGGTEPTCYSPHALSCGLYRWATIDVVNVENPPQAGTPKMDSIKKTQ